ncbi:MAG: NADH:flavin oxidoreductase/NADH oxidase [Candidatus Melainabacteria bacterium]|nr:NADH:flavin oxidoreductase/NADH oxidase [Candidatus Melainabacteria bacterium]
MSDSTVDNASAQHAGCPSAADHDRAFPDFDLLSPLTIRGITLHNRVVVSPMCQYSSEDGMADDWHLVHLGSRAVGGAGLVFTEAAAVTADGRITPGDLGIWDDKHIEMLTRITKFIHRMGSVAGIQLAHAGRKASCLPPWKGGAKLTPDEGGWDVVAPSAIPFNSTDPLPVALDEKGIEEVVTAFEVAAKRALKAGFKIIEIHAAHGYLMHEFLSPLSNQRTDQYGGSLENRMRLVLRVATALRKLMPDDMPLFVRISATDWMEGGWDVDQSVVLSTKLKEIGVDLMDCSSGALVPHAKIPAGKNYQVPFACRIREEAGMMTGAVGLITEVHQANEIVTSGSADLVFIAREFLREPYWTVKAEQALDQEPNWPIQYGYAVRRRPR